ncbi:hypothetical protein C0585_07150 [Candidatus Woesearchaeota archaeon]|nr:MAG: hypothetical protein C0585_07150 [Candidatus Woesearchaeota archaeon]
MEIRDIVAKTLKLEDRIKEIGQGYYHSTPISTTNTLNQNLYFGLSDWGLIGALTESTILLTGDTDRGKTDFAKILMTSLFGQEEKGWHKTDIDLDFGSMTYSDTNFNAISDGLTSSELFKGKDFLYMPGLIWDEPNRAPAKLLNKLLHILEKDITLENGEKLKSGFTYEDLQGVERQYQFNMLAMNEGDEFVGTSEVDRALRRRQTIEIPMDNFPTNMLDKILMARRKDVTLDIRNGEGCTKEVIDVYQFVKNIPISKEAEHLRLYLQSMNYCANSLTNSKRGIHFSEELCSKPLSESVQKAIRDESGKNTKKSCHYLASYPDKMCPNIYEVTDGISIRLTNVAKAHALIRTIKTLQMIEDSPQIQTKNLAKRLFQQQKKNKHNDEMIQYLEKTNPDYDKKNLVQEFARTLVQNIYVEPQDIRSCLPFVAFSKIQMNPHWVKQNYQGSKMLALQKIGNVAYENVSRFQTEHPNLFHKITEGGELNKTENQILSEIYNADPWLKKSVEGYDKILSPNKQDSTNLLDLIA